MSRKQEYLKRMKALGYEPSLVGMDDDDIEWELSKMEEAERRRTAQPPPLRTVYRPVDPGLAARLLRMFGQPYDKSAIPKGQEFYLNGWDDGEDDGLEENLPDIKPPEEKARPAFDYNPWARAWRPDWGPGGNPLLAPKPWPVRDFPLASTVPERFAGRNNAGSMVQLMSADAAGNDNGETAKAGGKWNKPLQVIGNIANIAYFSNEFAKEVEKEALRTGDKPELARRKGEDAGGLYGIYLSGVAGGSLAAGRFGMGAVTAATTTGIIGGDKIIKPLIKEQILGKTEADYNKPLFPGVTPPGPG